MKIVVTSDWHLDSVTSGFDRFDDICAAVDETVQAAMDEKADYYMMLGDLCNPHTVRSHRAIAKAIDVGVDLEDAGIRTFWITGNHDVVEDGTGANTMLALRAAGFTVFDNPGLYWCGTFATIALPFAPTILGYDPADIIKSSVRYCGDRRSDSAPLLIAGHLNLEGISPGSETEDMPRGREVFWPVDALKEHFPTTPVVGGHYHKQQDHDGVHLVGSLARLTFGEQSNKPQFLVLEV